MYAVLPVPVGPTKRDGIEFMMKSSCMKPYLIVSVVVTISSFGTDPFGN